MMTPERRAEIEAKIAKPYADDVDGYRSTEMKCAFMDAAIPEELLAEIDRLNKIVNQAIYAAFDGIEGCCQNDPTTPRCESCGVPLVKHLGLTGTCAKLMKCQDELESVMQDAGLYLSLLRRVIRMSCLTVERCPAGYPDVAEFLREEEARKG